MSLRTRVNGFTAWVNLRMRESNVSLSDVMVDLMNGTNMKVLVESMTGYDMDNVQSFDGLTQQQKVTRAEWIIKELKKRNVIPIDVYMDARLVAMRSADHVPQYEGHTEEIADELFDFLWRLVSHDVWFVWERAEYLQNNDPAVLVKAPFKWIAERSSSSSAKKKDKSLGKPQISVLSGFAGSAQTSPKPVATPTTPSDVVWPDREIAVSSRSKNMRRESYPKPDDCIVELINTHLKRTQEGQKLQVTSIDDTADHRVLCCLINSFVPHTFTSEVLPNDRWTINLCLDTANKMFHGNSKVTSADLAEGDTLALTAFFCYFFMIAYKYRQCKGVTDRIDMIHQLIREHQHSIQTFTDGPGESADIRKKTNDLSTKIAKLQEELLIIEGRFDVPYCRNWVDHVLLTQKQTHSIIRDKISQRFDMIDVPRSITINDLSLALNINLNLTGGVGFYQNSDKEQCSEYRKIVLRNKETGEFIDDFTARNKESIRKILGLKSFDVVEVNPGEYPQYDFFFEAPSRNKTLKAGSVFLYQVFPGNHIGWHRQFIKAIKENEVESVKNIIAFFKTQQNFINAKEQNSGNTALHWACRMGCYSITMSLLEHGANINILNNFRQTPLFSAVEGMQRRPCKLLIEWGCNVNIKNLRGMTAFETIKNDEFRDHLITLYERLSSIVPKIVEGDIEALKLMVKEHITGEHPLCTLRSRCINGSTLLHTAAYFGLVPVVKSMLSHRVEVNLTDYKGATPLHRVRNVECMKALLEAGAFVNIEDNEGNSPLHVKCFGETDKPSELDCIEMLIQNRARLLARNHRFLLPIHCCAMQGRVDAIELLLKYDAENNSIRAALNEEDEATPPSLMHLAIANDHLDCAKWLLDNGFYLKTAEPGVLVEKILTETIKSKQQADMLKFLFECGATVNPCFPNGNTALHFAAMIPGTTEVLELLLSYGADINARNSEQTTPLFFSCQTNNMFSASILIANGADYRLKNNKGLTALDMINDFDEWIESGFFSDDLVARLKAYSLKHSRDLVRAIGQRVVVGQNPHSRANTGSKTMNLSKSLLRPISPPPLPAKQTRPVYVTKSLPALLSLPPVPKKKYPDLQPTGSYLMF